MADQLVAITPGTGVNIDVSEVTTSKGVVERQRMVVTDDSTAAALAKVQNSAPGNSDYGLTVRNISEKAQSSSGSGVPGMFVQGLVNLNPPAYTDGNLDPISLTINGAIRTDGTGNQVVQNGTAITTTGSVVVDGLQYREINILTNITGTVSGTTPVMVISVQDLDPVNNSTVVGQAVTGANITATATVQLLTHSSKTGTVLVKWTITGTSPSFGGTNISLNSKDVGAAQPQTGVKTSVNASASSVTILAANTQRKQAIFTNSVGAARMYLDFSGGTASSTSYSVTLVGGQTYELNQPVYTGLVTGIWDSASGTCQVTELT